MPQPERVGLAERLTDGGIARRGSLVGPDEDIFEQGKLGFGEARQHADRTCRQGMKGIRCFGSQSQQPVWSFSAAGAGRISDDQRSRARHFRDPEISRAQASAVSRLICRGFDPHIR